MLGSMRMYWKGRLDHIHICAKGADAMTELREAELVAGKGIEGDRYFLGTGRSPACRSIILSGSVSRLAVWCFLADG